MKIKCLFVLLCAPKKYLEKNPGLDICFVFLSCRFNLFCNGQPGSCFASSLNIFFCILFLHHFMRNNTNKGCCAPQVYSVFSCTRAQIATLKCMGFTIQWQDARTSEVSGGLNCRLQLLFLLSNFNITDELYSTSADGNVASGGWVRDAIHWLVIAHVCRGHYQVTQECHSMEHQCYQHHEKTPFFNLYLFA